MGEYSDFKRSAVKCKACDWTGLGHELAVGEVFEGGQISEYHCPKCEAYFGAVPWPKIGEYQGPFPEVATAAPTSSPRITVTTLVSWAFLAIVLGAFGWYLLSTLWGCVITSRSRCNASDGEIVGSVLGLVLLLGVPALVRRMRRR